MKKIECVRTKDELIEFLACGKKVKYLCFWGHTDRNPHEVSKTCFSQWYEAKFEIDGIVYATAEHYMMAEKARLFESKSGANTVLLKQIIEAAHPQKAKQLGRQIEGFTNDEWRQKSFDVVVKGNVAKFSQNPKLANFLIGTGKRVIVEASPADKIWGIGLVEDHNDATNPVKWKGLNFLGFALMEVREILSIN